MFAGTNRTKPHKILAIAALRHFHILIAICVKQWGLATLLEQLRFDHLRAFTCFIFLSLALDS